MTQSASPLKRKKNEKSLARLTDKQVSECASERRHKLQVSGMK